MVRGLDFPSTPFSKKSKESCSKQVNLDFYRLSRGGCQEQRDLTEHLERDALTKTFAKKGLPRQALLLVRWFSPDAAASGSGSCHVSHCIC